MRKWITITVAALGLAAVAVWKYDSIRWQAYQLRGFLLDLRNTGGDTLPTPEPPSTVEAATLVTPVAPLFDASASPEPPNHPATQPPSNPTTQSPIIVATPPPSVTLDPPKWEKQGINNCGPATLAMYLRFYGWQGDQNDIARVVHPNEKDKNVRWDELVYYVKTHAGWLDALFRVGGTAAKLKLFLANGYPVVIETGYELSDVGWVGHYLLITGYDDTEGVFIVQDATAGANQRVPYEKIDEYWQQFNRLYIVIFPPADSDTINALLGDDADETINRQHALEVAQSDVVADPENPFAHFNLGSNLNYFDRYAEAADAFDTARELGLPKRMLFYQFGPYRAYFNVGRYDDVIDLSTFTLDYRPDLEESYFWRGWAEYMLGDSNSAIADWRNALGINPTFTDAKTALESVGAGP